MACSKEQLARSVVIILAECIVLKEVIKIQLQSLKSLLDHQYFPNHHSSHNQLLHILQYIGLLAYQTLEKTALETYFLNPYAPLECPCLTNNLLYYKQSTFSLLPNLYCLLNCLYDLFEHRLIVGFNTICDSVNW